MQGIVRGRWVGVIAFMFAAAACHGPPAAGQRVPGDSGNTGGTIGTEPPGDAGGARDADAAPDAAVDPPSCGLGSAGSLIWSTKFTRDRVDGSPASGVLDAAPVGLVVCGDGLCLLGKLDSRVRFDRELVAQGDEDAYLVKLTTQGVPVWSARLGGQSLTDRFVAASLAADDPGNLVVAGSCRGQLILPTGGGGQRVVDCSGDLAHLLVARFDPSGASVWSADLGTSYIIPASIQVAVDHGGRTVVAAHVGGPIAGPTAAPERAVVIAWDADGTERFRHSFNGGITYPTGLAVDAQGNIVLVGFFHGVTSSDGDGTDGGVPLDTAGSAVCALKLNASGGLVWSRCFAGMSQQALAPQLALGPDGSVVLAGTFVGELDFAAIGRDAGPSPSRLSSRGQTDIYLAKLDPDGEFVWQRQLGNADYQEAFLGIATTPEGAILLPAITRGPLELDDLRIEAGSSSSPFIAEFSADGRASFATQLGQSAYVSGSSGVTVGGCRDFYLAADYSGDLLAPGAPTDNPTIGLAVIAGRY
jgi:hypothetical protein